MRIVFMIHVQLRDTFRAVFWATLTQFVGTHQPPEAAWQP